jgi:hypothetical protein
MEIPTTGTDCEHTVIASGRLKCISGFLNMIVNTIGCRGISSPQKHKESTVVE